MKGEIIGEDQEDIGALVTDNEGEQHQIEMHKKGGEIYAHDQDGYPDDPCERTRAGNIHVNQARRFAKYWVYRKRGYDTVPPTENPDRIIAAAIALTPLEPDTAETHLGDFYQHFQSITGTADSPVEMPEGVPEQGGGTVYQKDIYVGLEDETLGTIAADILADPKLMELVSKSVGVGGETPVGAEYVPSFKELIAEASDRDPDSLPSLSEGLLLEATSGIHVHWDDPPGEYHTQWGDQPDLGRDPAARIEIFPFEPESITELQAQVARHLLCQIRDCYLTMGIAPPEQFRILGHGRHEATGLYASYDIYDEYFDPNAEIDTWYGENTPEGAYEHEPGNKNVQTKS
ncbi:hypothetical protein [Halogeometricum borinquense]|uniref:hypothetical protein n=1 Tax=Halogeometricum borinquense TaxID=60847 RepID=UPI00343D642A